MMTDIMSLSKDDMLCCSSCGDVIIKSSTKGLKIRTKILIIGEDTSLAVCKQCGSEIPIPVSLDLAKMESVLTSAKMRLFVSR
jgi:hypothetical protein